MAPLASDSNPSATPVRVTTTVKSSMAEQTDEDKRIPTVAMADEGNALEASVFKMAVLALVTYLI